MAMLSCPDGVQRPALSGLVANWRWCSATAATPRIETKEKKKKSRNETGLAARGGEMCEISTPQKRHGQQQEVLLGGRGSYSVRRRVCREGKSTRDSRTDPRAQNSHSGEGTVQ